MRTDSISWTHSIVPKGIRAASHDLANSRSPRPSTAFVPYASSPQGKEHPRLLHVESMTTTKSDGLIADPKRVSIYLSQTCLLRLS